MGQAERVISKVYGAPRNLYRVLMKGLPAGEKFEVVISSSKDIAASEQLRSDVSKPRSTLKSTIPPAAPRKLEAHRTDPRSNPEVHDGSVCIDLHWSHPHPRLSGKPDD